MYFYLFYIDFIKCLYYIELTQNKRAQKCEQLKRWLTTLAVKNIAERLGVTNQTVSNWVTSNYISRYLQIAVLSTLKRV